jgi:hypothetical protein
MKNPRVAIYSWVFVLEAINEKEVLELYNNAINKIMKINTSEVVLMLKEE